MQHTHAHPFNSPFSGTTRVSRYQKGKTNLDFTEARDSEWQWHQLGHAPRSRQITTLATHHSVFYRPDALPAAQPTASKHWRDTVIHATKTKLWHAEPPLSPILTHPVTFWPQGQCMPRPAISMNYDFVDDYSSRFLFRPRAHTDANWKPYPCRPRLQKNVAFATWCGKNFVSTWQYFILHYVCILDKM